MAPSHKEPGRTPFRGSCGLLCAAIGRGKTRERLRKPRPRARLLYGCSRLLAEAYEIDKAVYIIFLTSLGGREKVVEALEAGADDYLLKPFNALALQARIRVGLRIINLQKALADRVKQLETAITELQDTKRRFEMPL